MLRSFLRKGLYVVPFLLLFSFFGCHSSLTRQWEKTVVEGDCPSVRYSKLFLLPCDDFTEFEIELLRGDFGEQLYLNSLTLLFPASDQKEDFSEIVLAVCQEEFHFFAERLLGGQRLRLSQEAKQVIINALLADISIEMIVGRYKTVIVPDQFAYLYY